MYSTPAPAVSYVSTSPAVYAALAPLAAYLSPAPLVYAVRAVHLLTEGLSASRLEHCVWVSLRFRQISCVTCAFTVCFAAARRHLSGDGSSLSVAKFITPVFHVVEYPLQQQQVCAAPAPFVENISPAPAGSHTAPAPVFEYLSPAPAVHASPAPVVESISLAPVVSCAAPAPAHTQLLPATEHTDDDCHRSRFE